MKRGIADISIPLFRIACGFVSKEPAREPISGVRIEPHPERGVLLVATDGHRIIVLHDVHGYCRKPMTLDAKQGLKAARADDKQIKGQESRWRITDGRPAGGLKRWRLPDDQKYPEWMKVIRALPKRGGEPTTFNARYIASFVAAARALDAENPEIQIVPGANCNDGMIVLFPQAPHAFGILMPMYSHADGSLPTFVQQLLADHKPKRAAKPKSKK